MKTMSSPVSPSALFSTSPTHVPSPPLSFSSLPTFPIEVQKRILYHALALPPLYPIGKYDTSYPVAGQAARQGEVRRVVERLNIHRAALTLKRVCKAWKREAAEYLYREPHLTPSNLFLFAYALAQGDKKWSDINLHPHSTPGRYVTTLDLTHLRDGYETPHPTALLRVLREIFPLIPNLTHLRLPTGSFIPFEEIRRAPFARRLRVLEGVQVHYDLSPRDAIEPVVRLLRSLPNLEMLSLIGPGDIEAPSMFELQETVQEALRLDKLHTLILTGVKSSAALLALANSDLPALRQVALTSYANCAGDLTHGFQVAHGDKITSLAYLQPREWPGFRSLPPIETLELHPNLESLSYHLPKDLLHLQDMLHHAPSDCPLDHLTLPKWTSNPSDRFDPLQHDPSTSGTGATRLMRSLCSNPPPRLSTVMIDGFRWVRADIGMRALQTGDSGEMRGWADRLRGKSIDLVDMDGKSAPSSGFLNYSGCGGGVVYDVKGRRRSSGYRGETGRPRTDRIDEDGG